MVLLSFVVFFSCGCDPAANVCPWPAPLFNSILEICVVSQTRQLCSEMFLFVCVGTLSCSVLKLESGGGDKVICCKRIGKQAVSRPHWLGFPRMSLVQIVSVCVNKHKLFIVFSVRCLAVMPVPAANLVEVFVLLPVLQTHVG